MLPPLGGVVRGENSTHSVGTTLLAQDSLQCGQKNRQSLSPCLLLTWPNGHMVTYTVSGPNAYDFPSLAAFPWSCYHILAQDPRPPPCNRPGSRSDIAIPIVRSGSWHHRTPCLGKGSLGKLRIWHPPPPSRIFSLSQLSPISL